MKSIIFENTFYIRRPGSHIFRSMKSMSSNRVVLLKSSYSTFHWVKLASREVGVYLSCSQDPFPILIILKYKNTQVTHYVINHSHDIITGHVTSQKFHCTLVRRWKSTTRTISQHYFLKRTVCTQRSTEVLMGFSRTLCVIN